MAFQQPFANQSDGGGFFGGGAGGYPSANPSDPSYYPTRPRPNSYFGGSSQHSGTHLRQASGGGFRDSHEMSAPSAGRASSSNGGRSRTRSAQGNQHAFGDDTDSDESSDEGQGFNVYNDFNNKGAKYSSAVSSADQYRSDPFASTASGFAGGSKGAYHATETTPEGARKKEDMVVMPHLGQDWGDEEAQKDKQWEGKLGKKKSDIANKRQQASRGFSSWARGERKFFGWLGWRQGVFLAFFSLVGIAVMLYFVIPRVPSLAYNNQTLMQGDNNSVNWNRTPANFSFNANMNLALDGRGSYIPAHAKNIQVTVNDLGSTKDTVEVGRGTLDSVTAGTKDFTPMTVPVLFKYSATNSSDPLWNTWYSACGHKWGGNNTRTSLQLSIVVQFDVTGLIGSKGASTQVNSVDCPIELAANAA